ncbi:hypothetical protein BHE74_00007308 [Ensete ventricosum]|nr:hypothetical protein GW17_00042146 [Ensete ventricosum]RWW84104.1 hypothetical protein BHE74_00007308 [Ensete ventricosum]
MQKVSSKRIAGKDQAITGPGVGEATRKDFHQEVKTPPLVGGSRFLPVLLSEARRRDATRETDPEFGRAAVTAEGSSWILTETGIESARGPSTALFPAHDGHVAGGPRTRHPNGECCIHSKTRAHMPRGPLQRPMNELLPVQ